MKKHIADRYERDPQGHIIIDVAADRVEELYSNFDRSAPFIRRDLDPELVDHLIRCAKEIGREPFTISFTLTRRPDEDRLIRIRRSVNNFFRYLVETQLQKVKGLVRRSMVLLSIGIALMFGSVVVNGRLGPDSSVFSEVMAQGLTVASWVALWEALATFLIDWLPQLGDVTLYQRLADARLGFRSEAGPPIA